MAAALAAIDRQPAGRNEITFRTEAPLDKIPRGVLNGNGNRNGNGNGARAEGRGPRVEAGELERALAEAVAEAISRLQPGSSLAIKGPGGDYRIEIHPSSDSVVRP
jgi:hypothetical protein